MWTAEELRRIALSAPIGGHLLRHDSKIVEREGWYQIITPSTRSTSANEIVLSDLEDHDADARIDEQLARYAQHAVPFKWLVYPWSRPADLGERLAARGMVRWDVRAMVAPTSLRVDPAPHVKAELVSHATLDAHAAVMAEGWKMDPDDARFVLDVCRERLAEPSRFHMVVAFVEGVPAGAAGTLVKEDGTGYLVGAVVLSAYRGLGLYRALLHARLAALQAQGVGLATTHAREATSAPMLERFGFDTVFRYTVYASEAR